jgi:beta-glucosidase
MRRKAVERWGWLAIIAILLATPFRLETRETTSSANIQTLIGKMTLDEKLSLVHGMPDPDSLGEAGYWPGVPRLGIPPLRFADGPAGVNVNKAATAMPSPIGLAATFDPTAARLYGGVLGHEARTLHQDVLLGPHINIDRDPLFGRNQTTFGEDPYLVGVMAAEFTRGVQDQGVMAQIKHLAGYNGAGNVEIDERTLHEIYLPAFEAAIRAGASSIMCAYNKLNGPYSCENTQVQNEIVRTHWGFGGFITSDWGATHSTEAIIKGLDLEMPGPREGTKTYFTQPLAEAIRTGKLPESALDGAVGHILNEMDHFHMFGSSAAERDATIDVEADAKSAQSIAEESAVLLKNEGNILPIKSSDLGSLILIGPTAGQLAVGAGGERGYGFEERFVSPLDALQRAAGPQGQTNVSYAVGDDLTGVPLSGAALSHDRQAGLLRKQTMPPSAETRIDESMDFRGASALLPGTSYTWTGTLAIPVEGDYTFMLQAAVGDGANGNGGITIDARKVFTARGGVVPPGFGGLDEGPNGAIVKKWASLLPTTDGRNNPRVTLHLSAGPHPIEVTAISTGRKPLEIRFNWMTPELLRSNIERAVAAAKSARTAVVFAWSLGGNKLALPDMQDELIQRVAVANPRTIVVLNTGFAVTMPWKQNVRAILEMWYPGQEGGQATADLLLGRANPGGKLPFTFPVKLADSAAYAPGHPERVPQSSAGGGASAGDVPLVKFSEGTAVGYRWFDQENIEPLFAFGHGFSYTRFQYSGLRISHSADGVDVTFAIKNVGTVEGSEVAQIYIGPVSRPPAPMAPESLAGFERVELTPGQSKIVKVRIDGRQLSYWSASDHQWTSLPDTRAIYVGSSSRDIRLRGTT